MKPEGQLYKPNYHRSADPISSASPTFGGTSFSNDRSI